MYVGYNPQSSSGMAANFMTQLKETGSRWQKPPRPRRIRGADQSHRKWGEVQEYQGDGNQLVLAGNKLAQEHNEYWTGITNVVLNTVVGSGVIYTQKI